MNFRVQKGQILGVTGMNLEYSYAGLTLYAEIHDFAKGAVRAPYTLKTGMKWNFHRL